MRLFSNVAYDLFDRSFGNYPVGGGLLDNVFSKEQVEKMSSSSEPKKEIKKAFSDLLPIDQDAKGKRHQGKDSGTVVSVLTEEYFRSASFQTAETEPPFAMLEKYVQDLVKTEGVLPRVGRAEMYEREQFIAELSKCLLESNPHIGALCYFGSFVRGRQNPHDIDLMICFKDAFEMCLTPDTDHSWEGPKSKGLDRKLVQCDPFITYRPCEDSYESFADMDQAFLSIENYIAGEKSLFRQLANHNTYEKGEEDNFDVSVVFQPYEFTSMNGNFSGGQIWVINSKRGDNYKAFFSTGKRFMEFNPDYTFKQYRP